LELRTREGRESGRESSERHFICGRNRKSYSFEVFQAVALVLLVTNKLERK
jgi:hypothetical protein